MDVIDQFLLELTKDNYSENTIKTYRQALQLLSGLDYNTVTTVDLMKILATNKSLKTVASRQSAMRKFFKWLKETGRIDHDPTKSLGSVRTTKSSPAEPIPESDYKDIMRTVSRLPLVPRVLFLLIAETDIGIHQALALDVEDIGESYIEAGETVFVFSPQTRLGRLLEKLCTQQKQGPLFTNSKKERAPYLWAYHWWGKVMRKLNMDYTMKQLTNQEATYCAKSLYCFF